MSKYKDDNDYSDVIATHKEALEVVRERKRIETTRKEQKERREEYRKNRPARWI